MGMVWHCAQQTRNATQLAAPHPNSTATAPLSHHCYTAAQALSWMLSNDITDVLDLTFTAETDFFGRKETVELVPGGKDLRVTEANKLQYVNLVARHRMTTSITAQINAFLEGFWQLVPRQLISIFNDHELELLIRCVCGHAWAQEKCKHGAYRVCGRAKLADFGNVFVTLFRIGQACQMQLAICLNHPHTPHPTSLSHPLAPSLLLPASRSPSPRSPPPPCLTSAACPTSTWTTCVPTPSTAATAPPRPSSGAGARSLGAG